ncbi:MAG: IclR family transcriptional regulator [Actinomycetota bacterium]
MRERTATNKSGIQDSTSPSCDASPRARGDILGTGVTRRASTLRIGLSLLERLSGGSPISVTELARSVRQDKSVVSRLLVILAEIGYAQRDSESRKYLAGTRLAALSGQVLGSLDIRVRARPVMAELAQAIGEAVRLAVPAGNAVVTIDYIENPGPFGVKPEVGQRDPLHCTAIGKASLAFLSETERAALISPPLARYTARTIVDVEDLCRHLVGVREAGFACDDGEYYQGIRCVAAPLFDATGRVTGMLGISGTTQRIPRSRMALLGRAVRTAALEVSARQGFTADDFIQGAAE